MIMWGKEGDGRHHDKHLSKFFQITRHNNLKCTLGKQQFKAEQASFFETTFTSHGCKTRDDTFQAINKRPQLTNVKDL